MTRTKVLALATVLAFALPLSACGGDDDKSANSSDGTTNTANPFGDATDEESSASPSDEASEETEASDPVESDLDLDGLDRDAVIKKMSDSILESSNDDMVITETEATCVSQEMVDALGLGRLAELGKSGDMELSDSEATSVANAMVDCDAISTTKVKDMMLKMMGASVPPAAEGCLDEAITDDLVRELALSGVTGGDSDALGQAMGTDLVACITAAQD